jgi:hypothetical protein
MWDGTPKVLQDPLSRAKVLVNRVETMGLEPTTLCVQTWASLILLDVDGRRVQVRRGAV